MNGPLHNAASKVREDFASCRDTWQAVALLYVGAVQQIDHAEPVTDAYATLDLAAIENASPLHQLDTVASRETIKFLIKEILNPKNSATRLTSVALSLIAGLGRPLFGRLSSLLATCPDPGNEKRLSRLFQQKLGNTTYRLMLSAYSNHYDFSGETDSLRQQLIEKLPVCGWSVVPPKILLRFVRVVPLRDNSRPQIFYLEHLSPTANARLAQLTADQGMSLAAIPMHRQIKVELEITKEENDIQSFRIIPPDSLPQGWDSHLTDQIRRCSERKVLFAVLPELMGSPDVNEVLLEAMSQCKNGFPLLVAGPSFHVQENGSWYNRMVIYCRQDPGEYETICTHNKFERFAENNLSEDCELGGGMTFLVTSIGVIALGICKDWLFLRSAGSPKAYEQFQAAQPVLALASSFTATVLEFENILGTLRDTRTPLVFTNACGPVSSLLRGGRCCAVNDDTKPQKLYDARSFIAAPKNWFTISDGNDQKVLGGSKGVYVTKAACNQEKTGDNTVWARILVSASDK